MPKFAKIDQIECPHCGQSDLYAHGRQTGKKRYRCQHCRKVFSPTRATKSRQHTPQVIGAAVDMYFDGVSYKRTAENIAAAFNIPEPSKQTIYNWVHDYSTALGKAIEGETPSVGNTWVADEMMVNVGGRKVWLWNVLDERTRYLLATHLTPYRTAAQARIVMDKAKKAAGKSPATIKTDKLRSYDEGIEDVFGAEAKHIKSEGIRSLTLNNNMSERLQGTIRARDKVLRGLKSLESGQRFLDGWQMDYNLFRPHLSLGQYGKDITPAEVARMDVSFSSWQDVAAMPVRSGGGVRTGTAVRDVFEDDVLETRLRTPKRRKRSAGPLMRRLKLANRLAG